MDRAERDTAREKEELRELIREAHEASKDLARTLKEVRKAIAEGVSDAAEKIDKTAREWFDNVQEDMNRSSRELNAGIERAQQHITRSLSIGDMELDPETDTIKVRFRDHGFFQEDAVVTENTRKITRGKEDRK